jgi:hypothetical protein
MHAEQDVAVDPMADEAFQRTPHRPWSQTAFVKRGQGNVGAAGNRTQFVRTLVRFREAFDSEPMLDDLEAKMSSFFGRSDALEQVTAPVCAANDAADVKLVAFAANRPRKNHAKNRDRLMRNILVEHEAAPDVFRRRGKTESGRNAFDSFCSLGSDHALPVSHLE